MLCERKGIGVKEAMLLILLLAVLLFTTTVMGSVFMAMLGMGGGTQFSFTMSELAAAYTTSHSFQENTEIVEGIPMQCNEIIFRNNTIKGELGRGEFYFTSQTSSPEHSYFSVECGFMVDVRFEDGKISLEDDL